MPPPLTFSITEGDTLPAIGGTVKDARRRPVTLQAGDVVRFRMSPVIEGLRDDLDEVATFDIGGSDVAYPWRPEDTAVPGVYNAEFHLELLGGLSGMTFPNGEHIRVVIKPKARARG